jgi:excisionase family DNA binding protein
VKAELSVPPELIDELIERLSKRLRPLIDAKKNDEVAGDLIFGVPRLSRYLGVSHKWIYEQTHRKAIPHYKIGNKQLRFRKRDIDKWLASLELPAVSLQSKKLKD